jgi:hypothetical protein
VGRNERGKEKIIERNGIPSRNLQSIFFFCPYLISPQIERWGNEVRGRE